MKIGPDHSHLNTFLYCQFGPCFEIHNGPNLIWEWFGPTVISAGLIIITGSSLTLLFAAPQCSSETDKLRVWTHLRDVKVSIKELDKSKKFFRKFEI